MPNIVSKPNDSTEVSLQKIVTLATGAVNPNDSTEESLRKIVTALSNGSVDTTNLVHTNEVGPNTDKLVTFNQSGNAENKSDSEIGAWGFGVENTNGDSIYINPTEIVLNNGATLTKGTTDGGLGGIKGIALKCSVDYELKWEAGRLYTMQQDGFTIRSVEHCMSAPTDEDDEAKGYVAGTRWVMDSGKTYVCTDATEEEADWELVFSQEASNRKGGGSVNTSGGVQGSGGSINTSNGGGFINTSGGYSGYGGSIVTSYSGGSIFTYGGWGLVGSNSSSGYYNSSYEPKYIGTELGYVGTIDMGGGILPKLMYFTNGVGYQGLLTQIAPNYTGWGIVGEESVLAYLRSFSLIGRNDIPIGDYWSQPEGSGSRIVTISLGAQTDGGYINTSAGGGSINTRGTGSIQLGVTGTRTTLNGSASGSNKTITLPNETGTIALTPCIAYGGIISASGVDAGSFSNGTFPMIQGSGTGGVITVLNGVISITSAGTGYVDGVATKAGGSRFNLVTQATLPAPANLPVITTTGGNISVGAFGTTANSFCRGNDPRLNSIAYAIALG